MNSTVYILDWDDNLAVVVKAKVPIPVVLSTRLILFVRNVPTFNVFTFIQNVMSLYMNL